MRPGMAFTVTVLIVGSLVSCSDGEQTGATTGDEDVSVGTTTAPVEEGSSSAAGRPTGSTEPWDLLYISDSSGWSVGEAYADEAAEALGGEVRLVSWREPGLSMLSAIEKITAFPGRVAEAEIIVLWANPEGSGVRDDHCFGVTASSPTPEPLTVDEWAPFAALFEQAFAAIWAARDGAPVVLRATDIYVPVLGTWEEFGVADSCTASFEAMSDAVRAAAESSGATMVSAYDVLNGADHDVDLSQAGYLRDDFHLNEAGGMVVAEALAAEGFEPSTAP